MLQTLLTWFWSTLALAVVTLGTLVLIFACIAAVRFLLDHFLSWTERRRFSSWLRSRGSSSPR